MTTFNRIYNNQGPDADKDEFVNAVVETLNSVDIDTIIDWLADNRNVDFAKDEVGFLLTEDGVREAINMIGFRDVAEWARNLEEYINVYYSHH